MPTFDDHPLLLPAAFRTEFPEPLGQLETTPLVRALLDLGGPAPLERSEDLRSAVRKLLRHGGHRPTGRGKPSAEYLVRAAGEAALPSINPAVDTCNAVSLHSGIPISVVDLDLAHPPFRVSVPAEGSYVFNASGQEIRLDGLLSLFDEEGPCANAVKDSQRTKTHPGTIRTLSVLWGPRSHTEHVQATGRWYRQLLEASGARTSD